LEFRDAWERGQHLDNQPGDDFELVNRFPVLHTAPGDVLSTMRQSAELSGRRTDHPPVSILQTATADFHEITGS
jgi:hypothetical protein